MDGTDKFINNRAPKMLLLAFVMIFALSAAAGLAVSEALADHIVSRQIESALSFAGGGRLTALPDPAAAAEGERVCSEYGISTEMSPRLMECWNEVRNTFFYVILSFSGLICIIGAVLSIRHTYKIYDSMEALRLECLKIAEHTGGSVAPLGEEFGCIRRISDGISLMAERMDYLTSTLKSEKTFLKEFLSDFSHQLKTSLAVIRLNSDMLREMENLPEDKKIQLSDEISDHIGSMEQMIISALKLAKLNADAIEYSMTETDISATCTEAARRISPLLREKQIAMKLSLRKDCSLPHDRLWLCEAIENIVKNSADHSRCTEISIEITDNPSAVTAAVSDNGKGIPQEDIPGLFERFGRKSGSVSMSSSGMGMSIAKKIVQAHGGEILVYSECGKGTRFELVFLK